MLKNVILLLNELNTIPYAEELIKELRQHHVDVWSGASEILMTVKPSESLVICESEEAAEISRKRGIGYLVYVTATNRNGHFPENLCAIEGFDEIDFWFVNHMYERSRGIPWTILTTSRCILREITVQDVDRLYEIYADPSITAYMEGLFENPEEERDFTRDYIKYMYGFFGFGLWLVIEKETGRIIGRAGITNRDGFDDLEIGYLIEASRQRQGYAEEVCRGILAYARERLGCERLNAFIDKENSASIALAEKLGFVWQEESNCGGTRLQRYAIVLS